MNSKKFLIPVLLLSFAVAYGFAQAQQPAAQEQGGAQGTTPTIQEQQDTRTYREGFSQVLVDFTTIGAETDEPTKVDFSGAFVLNLPQEEASKLVVDYALNNWRVHVQNSIRFPNIISASFAKAVEVTGGEYQGQVVLGARFTFPAYPYEMTSEIVPPFAADISREEFVGKGTLRNVGLVRSAYLTVYGLNQPERIFVVTEDSAGNEYEYSFGDLKFVGWRTLEWTNPNYLEDVRAREIQSLPLYPQASADRRFKSIKIRRSGIYGTQDFVTYVRDVKVTFDKALDDTLLTDIDNEAVWGITNSRRGLRDAVVFQRTLVDRYLEYLEARKKYDFAGNGNAAAPAGGAAQPAAADGQGGAAAQ